MLCMDSLGTFMADWMRAEASDSHTKDPLLKSLPQWLCCVQSTVSSLLNVEDLSRVYSGWGLWEMRVIATSNGLRWVNTEFIGED